MVERGDGARLAFESLAPQGIGSKMRRQHFDRDVTAKACVERLVDLAHASRPDSGADLVRTDGQPVERPGAGEVAEHLRRRLFEKVLRCLVRRQQAFDFAPQPLVGRTGFIEIARAAILRQRARLAEDLFQPLPRSGVGTHGGAVIVANARGDVVLYAFAAGVLNSPR